MCLYNCKEHLVKFCSKNSGTPSIVIATSFIFSISFFLLYFQYSKWSMVTETFANKIEIENPNHHYRIAHIKKSFLLIKTFLNVELYVS